MPDHTVAENLFQAIRKLSDAQRSNREELFLAYCKNTLSNTEKLHFDYKVKTNAKSQGLDEPDQKNLAKAVSGFANSDGGILIWGIQDKSLKSLPLNNPEQFLADLLQLAAACTDPPVPGIDGEVIPSLNQGEGYVVLYVPSSELPPHRIILRQDKISQKYYFRSGNSFMVAPHYQLEAMFGRRPKPVLGFAHYFRIGSTVTSGNGKTADLYVVFGIQNSGRGTAKSPNLEVQIVPPDTNNLFGLTNERCLVPKFHKAGPYEKHRYNADGNMVIHCDMVRPFDEILINVSSRMTTLDDVKIKYTIVAEGIRPISGTYEIHGSEILDYAKEKLR